MLAHETLAYFAGLFDGEGTVELRLRHHNTIGTRILIYNTSLDVMDWLLGYFDGTVYARKNKTSSYKTQYVWQTSGEKARDTLKLVAPFLIIKAKQVKLVLKFWELREEYGITSHSRKNEDFVAIAEPLLYAVSALNRRGNLT